MPLAATLLDMANAIEIAKLLMTPKCHKNTKSASIHTTQVDRPLSLVRQDAITEYWLAVVICELKSLPTAEAVIWFIVEQTYVRQQCAQPRTTSPNCRGRTSSHPSSRSEK
ncbi:hypothetical protein AZE42_04937 [Rhizopogon vesiculosus]|uniref:Uncharacterized protein n=1 Tax=Rhizopogon vesiculosus TaxID=180088 RepID=A0A1J8QT27_9AGAM|nr:hypothetical protein AZE42_04937 [Rhizopogon vesiculosus]